MEPTTIIFILIYLLSVLLAATKVVPMSIAALIGALLTAWFGLQYGVFTYEQAISFIDMRLIGLLAKGSPAGLFIFLGIVSAAVSMFLSDSTAMLLMAAATVTIAKLLKYDPVPYFLSSIMMINLGGTSTLIGSTSNMIIGVQTGMSFNDFIRYLSLGEVALWGLTILALYMLFKPRLGEKKVLPEYDPWKSIENKKLFFRSIFILTLLVILFLTLETLVVGPEAIALGCAILALVLSGSDPAEIFRRLDWETVFFIAAFMFVVGGLGQTGILNDVSTQLVQIAGSNSLRATLLTLWFSGLASSVVSNAAIALTFIPILTAFSGINDAAITSALVLGTNLGGATTPLSGSVVIIALGTLKREGISMSFQEFTKIGLITSFLQLAFASFYLIVRFGLGG